MLLVLALASCKKEGISARLPGTGLQGTWELRAIQGGMLPNPASILPGNGDNWVFTAMRYERYFKDTLYEAGEYLLSKGTGTDPNTQRKLDQLLLGQQGALPMELVNDTLKFYYGPIAADGYIAKYVRIE